MGIRVEICVPQEYPPYCIALLEALFANHAVAAITKHFTEGQSGTFVFLVEPTRQDGENELPVVVKIGPSHLLEQEWRAAQDHIASRLPDFIPISGQLASIAVTTEDSSTAVYSAARYQLAGNGLFAIETLRTYALTASADALWTVLEKRLFQQLDRIWRTQDAPVQRRLNATYDRVLPVNLLLEFAETTAPLTLQLAATHDPASYPPCQPGDWVQLHNFVITEIDAAERTLTLNLPQPEGLHASAYRLRIRNIANLEQYHLHETVDSLTGRVVKTRQLLLQEAIRDALPTTVDLAQPLIHLTETDQRLPNPLLHWPALLQEQIAMRIGTVHGDLNMGNVLVDVDAKTTFLIDCAHAHRDHVLYDLVRLESEVLLHLAATYFYRLRLPPTKIHELYSWLDYVTQRAPDAPGVFALPQPLLQTTPDLQAVFIVLTTIRNAARQYLARPNQWREYYGALALTLLGSLKFASLERTTAGTNPKAVTFWGAATILARLEQPAHFPHLNWQPVTLNDATTPNQQPAQTKPTVYIDYSDQRRGVFFEGNAPVTIQGNVITGDTVNTTNFHGPVTGPIHTGSGDIHIGATADTGSKAQKPSDDPPPKETRQSNSETPHPIPSGVSPSQGQTKILFLTANPHGTVWLRTAEEARAIDQVLRQAEHRVFEIHVHQAVRIDDLQELLLRHCPDIVHFSGHGTAANELILQDANGNSMPVSGKNLRTLFGILKDQIRCVVLNACYTEEQAKSLAEVIDCVVGISNDMTDQASIHFATAFYRALGYGLSVQEAFRLGQAQIELGGVGEGAALHLHGAAAAQTRFVGEQPTNAYGQPRPSPKTDYEDRRLDAAMPSRCSLNQRTEVRVLVATSSSEGLKQFLPDYTKEGYLISKQDVEASPPAPIEFPIDPVTGRIQNTTLCLKLVAPDFKIDQDIVYIQILPNQDSGMVTFHLTPVAKPSLGRVKVELYDKDKLLLTTVSLTTQIVLTSIDLVTQIVWQYLSVMIGVNTKEAFSGASATSDPQNRTDIHNAEGSFISIGSGDINVDQSHHVSLHLFTPPLDAVKSWANDFFRLKEADEHARSSWAGMTLYLLGATMKRISDEGFLTFLLTVVTAAFAIWFITPILAWPQTDAQARLFAVIRFGVASLVLPVLIALLIKPEGTEKFPLHETGTQWRLLLLKLAGAWTGFGALAGTTLITVILWYHLFGMSMPTLGRWFLALLPPFFAYVSARRIPLDRYKMFDGELRLHDADRLFLAVFALFGPGLAALICWGHWFLINQATMRSVLLGIIGLTVWEIHRHDKRRFPDFIVIAILGLLLPFGFLLLFFFDMRPLAPLTFARGEVGLFAVLSTYVLGTTLLLATVRVRRRTHVTLSGVFSLLALLLVMSAVSTVNLWVGRAVVIGMVLLWYLWGRRQFRDWQWLRVHPSVDCLMAALIGATVLGRYTTIALWVNATLFGLTASVLVLWAYRKNDDATENHPQQEFAQYSPFIRWGVIVLIIVAITGLSLVITHNFTTDNSSSPTPSQDAANAPTALETVTASVKPTALLITPATATPAATSTMERLTVARSAPGANRYFIEGPNLAAYELEELLVVYAQDSAGNEFDVAVVFVVDKNVGNLIVKVIFQHKNYPLDSLAALQLDDQLNNIDLIQMVPLNDTFVGFMLNDETIRLVPNAKVAVGDQLEAMQLTHGGDTLPFPNGPLMVRIDSIGTNGDIARVSSATELPPLGTLLVLTAESPTSTPSPTSSPTQVVTPIVTDTPTPQPQSNLPIYELFDGVVALGWKNVRGEWGVNNQRLQVRRFEDGLAGILIAYPKWPRYAVQMVFGTLKHLDDSGNVNVPFSNFHVLIHFQGNTDGYWFTVANGGVACTIYQNNIGTRLTPSTNQWGEMFDLLSRRYTGDHELEITVRDNQYAFTLDDEEICSFQDDTYPEGSLGVVVSEGASGHMWIDNVRISPFD